MDKRAILAVVLSILVLILWTQFFSPQPPPPQEQPQTGTQEPAQAPEAGQKPKTASPAPASEPAVSKPAPNPTADSGRPARVIEVDNGAAIYKFSENGGRLVSCRLLGIKESSNQEAGLKELVQGLKPEESPLGLVTLKGSLQGLETALFEAQAGADQISARDQEKVIKFRWVSESGREVIKTYTIRPGKYLFGLKVEVVNHSQKTVDDNLGLVLNARHDPKEGGRYAFKGFGAYVNGELTEEKPKNLDESKIVAGQVSWGGYENSYFLQAVVPLSGQGSFKGSLLTGKQDENQPVIHVRYNTPPFSLAPGEKQEFDFEAFFGPKRIEVLKKAGHDLAASINMGWFDVIAKPFLYFLNYVEGVVKNFGVAIIVLTIGVKIIFWPLTQKSYKSMRAMQKLQPQMAKLKERYKDDKQKFNQEMMALYRAHKVNPMGGCLPMIIQIPVFIALYRLLDYAIELRHAPFMLWIDDLSAPDRLFEFPFSVPLMEQPYGIPVLTLLMGASMFLQQKMTPTPGDPTQAKVMLLMPIVFTFVFINFPSGLVLYWLTNNVLSIGQQLYVNRGLKKS
ncbi:MAG: membrane protein insertase YidC [Deltaproteobacteria bacterium]|nr:membrane protein insertase YidC [Deltaproteobacteria bacterium]